jgi:AraC-like DNA-binding protein
MSSLRTRAVDVGGGPAEAAFEQWRSLSRARVEVSWPRGAGPLRARLRAVGDEAGELVDYRSDNARIERTRRKCLLDDLDQVCVVLVREPRFRHISDGRERTVLGGQLYVVDFTRPFGTLDLFHHETAIVLPRETVRRALGADPRALGGQVLGRRGVGGLLASHLEAVSAQFDHLDIEERATALRHGVELATAALRRGMGLSVDSSGGVEALYAAALRTIDGGADDPLLTPERIARRVGCSRASLYRLFAGRERSVAESLWEARLTRARRRLGQPELACLTVSEIAYRSGFLEPASFARMYRRRFGETPSDTRARAADGG